MLFFSSNAIEELEITVSFLGYTFITHIFYTLATKYVYADHSYLNK